MVQRPPFDRNNPQSPGGFDPRYEGEGNFDRGPDPRFGGRPDPRYEGRPDPRYDNPDPFDQRRASPPPRRPERGGPNRWLLILGGLLLIGAILFGLSLTRSGPGSDALDGEGAEGNAAAEAAADPEARCAAPATYELIKRELFRQAGATRGSNEETFAQLPSYATLRISNPVLREQDAGLERVSCTGTAALDLPPGLAVVGGRRTLTSNIGYNVQPSADGSGDVVTLTGAEGIVVPLATLARVGAASARPADSTVPLPEIGGAPAPGTAPAAPAPAPAPAPPPATQAPRPAETVPDRAPPPPAADAPTASVRPSFNCARARTRGEIAVCNSGELASLDRQMASFYQSSFRSADPQTRAQLERTRNRFLAYRDRCRSDACIADAYRGRITEIRDIIDGR